MVAREYVRRHEAAVLGMRGVSIVRVGVGGYGTHSFSRRLFAISVGRQAEPLPTRPGNYSTWRSTLRIQFVDVDSPSATATVIASCSANFCLSHSLNFARSSNVTRPFIL